MQVLNRSAITVNFKEPFAQWINQLEPTTPVYADMLGESSTYLIPEGFDNAEMVMKKYFNIIFELELFAQWEDETDWPSPITFAMFNEWFSYEISGFVYDLPNQKIGRTRFEP